VTRALACVALAAVASPAQQVRVAPAIGALGPPARARADEDPGMTVEMFDNPNLDSYLRRSRSLLERRDFTGAIELLQDVIEGRTVEVVAIRDDESAKPAAGGQQPADRGAPGAVMTARNAVFSQDGRLYRPVWRLCHELLAAMPEVGLELYRTAYEFAAAEMLDEALKTGSTAALEKVANRYFVTLPAGRAMVLLADRLMHAGRYRGAVQVLRDLLEVYPAQHRDRLGVREVWCEFKIALCLQLAGEVGSARQAVEVLAAEHPDESLRISGQLESLRALSSSALFSRDTVAIDAPPDAETDASWLNEADLSLVPLWQYRFQDPHPYRDPKPNKNSRSGIWIESGPRSTEMPIANRYGPATWVAFDRERRGAFSEPRALFLEHYRLRMADAASGVMLRAGDGPVTPPPARENHPRVRIAAADNSLLRPVEDEQRRYVVLGHRGNSAASDAVLKAAELVAYERDSWERAWSSIDWLDGQDGLRHVTFLAAPVVFGERLLLPSLRREAYTLECLDRSSGRPLWHTPLHAGGSPFFKAPGTRVAVQGGVAYVVTNAGCLAAVDAFAGELKWVRRYERVDPYHGISSKKKRARGGGSRRFGQQFTQVALANFEPADLILHDGVIVLAPCDGQVLLAVDVATGEPVWMLDADTHHAPYGKLTQLVGASAGKLFALSRTHLVCVELEGGLVRWMRKLPAWAGPRHSGRGRGAVVSSMVVLPNMRELLLFDCDGEAPMQRLRLPPFDEGREPLQGACNVVVQGPWLAAGYEGGVEVFSTAASLKALASVAEDPLRRASYLAKSGASSAAEGVLNEAMQVSVDAAQRLRVGRRLLSLVRARAEAAARDGDLKSALATLDTVRGQLTERELRLNWHLARVEICKASGDLRAHDVEQQRLYDYMEGRG